LLFWHLRFLVKYANQLKEVLVPVLSPSTLPFGFAQDKLRIDSVEGLFDVNQVKPEFANHPS
jgi:hypothetical protein